MTFIKSKKNAYRKLQRKKRRKQRQRENKKINKALRPIICACFQMRGVHLKRLGLVASRCTQKIWLEDVENKMGDCVQEWAWIQGYKLDPLVVSKKRELLREEEEKQAAKKKVSCSFNEIVSFHTLLCCWSQKNTERN